MPLDPLPAWVPTRQREIGDRIRRHRNALGISQVQLGERIGRDHKTIHRWENGHTAPDLVDLLLVAHAVGIEVEDLVRREGLPRSAAG